MKLKGMTSPTPSTDSLSGATNLGSFVDSSDLGLGLDLVNGCHGSSSSSSTCSSIVFPHLSISNGVLSSTQMNHQQPPPSQHQSGFIGNGITSPVRGICGGGGGGVGGGGGGGGGSGPGGIGISIKCNLCHETYNKPKVLPCLHTFCQDCLEKAQDVGDRLVCPSCRLECTLSSQGVAGLLPDYALCNIVSEADTGSSSNSPCSLVGSGDGKDADAPEGSIEGETNENENTLIYDESTDGFDENDDSLLHPSSESSSPPKGSCTSCKSNKSNAVARCFDCSNMLCSNCVMAHQFMHCFEGHHVVYMPGIEPGKENGFGMTLERQVSCTHHKGEKLQFYCRTCAIPACPECVATEHPKSHHETEALVDCETKYVKHLSQYIHDFRMKSVALHDVLKSFETASTRLQSHYSKAQSEVNEAFNFYRTLLDERKSELLKELDNLYITRQVTLSVVTQRVQETLDRMYQTVEFGERLLSHASPPQILVFKKLLETRLQALLAGVPEPSVAMSTAAAGELEFVANYSAVQAAVRNSLGYIRAGVGNDTMAPNNNNNKQPPAPIARPGGGNGGGGGGGGGGGSSIPGQQVNGYQVNSNHQNDLTSPLSSSGLNGGCGGGGGGSSGVVNGMGSGGSSSSSNGSTHHHNQHDSILLSKRLSSGELQGSGAYNQLDVIGQCSYEKWSIGSDNGYQNGHKDFSCSSRSDFSSPPSSGTNNDPLLELTSKLMAPFSFPKAPAIKRQKMIYHCKFGEFGTAESQFTEPSGVAVNANNEIIVADTNNHRIQIFDREGRFKFQFGECGKRDGQLLYPNRVAVVRPTGDIVVTERSPTHQIQIYNQYGQFVRKFGANILQHPRGITVDNKGRIIVVECKVMRVIIFDQMGTVLHKFGCSKHLEFPNGVVVNDSQEIFISDNRAHCVKVFSYEGVFLRQIGGEGLTNYPIGVGINANGEILVADNHNNFNLTIFTQDGQLVSALESKVKHAQCFDVALMDDGSVVLASKDYRLYIYRYIQVPPIGL